MKHMLTAKAKVSFLKSLKTTLFVQTAVLVSLTIFFMVVTAFFLARAELQRNTFEQLELLVSNKEDLLETVLSDQREQIATLASDTSLATQKNIKRLLGFSALALVKDQKVVFIEGESELTTDAINSLQSITQTTFVPQFSDAGLDSYMIISPLRSNDGHLVVFFDARPLLSVLLDTQSSAGHMNLVIGFAQNNELKLLRASRLNETHVPLYIGFYEEQLSNGVPLARAVSGLEGREKAEDYAGIAVLASYRSVPSLGWGLVASIDQHITFEPVRRLALTMFGAGLVIVILSILIVWSIAGRITSPLLHLQQKLQQLETKHWEFERDIFTGNEIEVVDAAARDLTNRLQDAYEHLEEKVADRTKELRDAHAQDRAVFQSMEYGLLVADAKGSVILMNEAAEQLTGWKHDDAHGKEATTVLSILGKDQMPLEKDVYPLTHVLSTKEKVMPIPDPGYMLREKDGATRPLHIIATPIIQSNSCIGVVAIFRDTTEEKKVDKMKSEFITLASHQLRTPISSIRWYVEMLLAGDYGKVTEEQQHYLSEIGAANSRMIRLVESLLNVSSLELGTFSLHNEEHINILEVMQDVEDSFKFDIHTKKLHVAHQIPKTTEDTTTCMDTILFRLIYQNIFGNAVKYTSQDGSIEVTVKNDEKAKQLIVSVKDNGIGIPKDQQSHVFEKLYRADNAKEILVDGSGLGLYICANAAEVLGAELSLESDAGKGSLFTVKIPLSIDCVGHS